MKNVLIAFAMVGLAGCSNMMGGGGSPDPRAGVLKTQPGSADVVAYVGVVNGRPYVYPETIVVTSKNVWIYWYIDPALGHRFADDAVVIGQPRSDFTNCIQTQKGDRLDSGLTYRCHDVNPDHSPSNFPRSFKYRIKLTTPSGGTTELDPWIVND